MQNEDGLWTYYASREGDPAEVLSLFRHQGHDRYKGLGAEIYHRQNGWHHDVNMSFGSKLLKGDLDASDIITQDEADMIINAWHHKEPAFLQRKPIL
jgi:hypothetical protein